MTTNRAPFALERSGGTLVRCKGIYVAQLYGSYAAMGKQHGELAAASCGDVVPLYMNQVIKNLIAHTIPSLAAPLAALLTRGFHWRNRSELGAEIIAHLNALAEAYNLRPLELERLFIMPDILHFLAGKSLGAMVPAPACSGFFACGNATQDGKMIIGRNFDFFGRGVWNNNNAVIVMHPDGGQRFCWLGALGVPASGQGFNESGLFVSLHSMSTRDLCTKGTPIFKIVNQVLAECTSLEEAITLITTKQRMCGLSVFVSDTRARKAAVVGFSARHFEVVRPVDEMLVRTNHYTTLEMQAREVGPHPCRDHTYGRFQRLTELLTKKYGSLVVEDVPVLLSDCVDPFEHRKRVTGNIVAAVNNVQSMVVSPDDDALWIAHGDFPVCHNDCFHGFRISALLAGDTAHYAIEDLPGAGQLNETERAALYEYVQAWSAHMDQLDVSKAVYHLLRGAELLPEEPIFPRMAGFLLLKGKKYERALPLLVQNTAYEYQNTLMRAEAHLWVGRCLDLLGRHSEAIVQYEIAAQLDAPPVSKRAMLHMDKPFKAYQMFSVSPEPILGTIVAKY